VVVKNRIYNASEKFCGALLAATAVSVVLFLGGALRNHSWEFAYLMWNLFLAWLPFGFALWLVQILERKVWSSWEALGISALWLIFLPNTFYMVSDFIHLGEVKRIDLLYDAVMFTSFIAIAVVLGVCSLYIVHLEIRKRFTLVGSSLWLALMLLLSSFAIYLGRDLRWNSWDVLTNPGGLLFDVSDRLMHPAAYPQMLLTVSIFLVLMCSMYGIAWYSIELIKSLSLQEKS
jgi:uncharacterized membrane protein